MDQQGVERGPSPAGVGVMPLPGECGCAGLDHHADWRRELRRAILSRVVPRLAAPARRVRTSVAVAPVEVDRFAEAALRMSLPGLLGRVDEVRAAGVGLDAVLLDLLSPAARRLGDLWLSDRLSFFDVTVGLGRLQAVMRALGPDFEGAARAGGASSRRILLVPVHGEQHVFGLSIVAAFFRRAGWDVTFDPAAEPGELGERLRAERFDVVGLSAASDAAVARMAAEIDALRRASRHRGIVVLAGGPAFLAEPDLAGRVGADAAARDATEAVQLAEALSSRAVAA